MALADDYRRQFAWRPWPEVFAALPPVAGLTVLDLGCGPGDLAAELARRGARVLGLDGNEELLAAARASRIAGAEFRSADLRSLPDPGVVADGLWCSFAVAYFCDLQPFLAGWLRHLRPGGFVTLVEIDDMFGHAPLGDRARTLFGSYVDDALATGRYDFRMGRKLGAWAERCGLVVERSMRLSDQELAFDGPALPEVLEAWGRRLDRMPLLHDHCGAEWPAVRAEFLACLARPDHRTSASVCCCIARRPG